MTDFVPHQGVPRLGFSHRAGVGLVLVQVDRVGAPVVVARLVFFCDAQPLHQAVEDIRVQHHDLHVAHGLIGDLLQLLIDPVVTIIDLMAQVFDRASLDEFIVSDLFRISCWLLPFEQVVDDPVDGRLEVRQPLFAGHRAVTIDLSFERSFGGHFFSQCSGGIVSVFIIQ